MSKFALLTTAIIMCASAPAIAESRDAASTEIRISGVVPTICRVEFSRMAVSPDLRRIDLGQMSQTCNDGAGFKVTLSYGSGFENARFVTAGSQVLLGAAGQTVILDSLGPRWDQQAAAIELDQPVPQNLTVSVRIEPNGATY